jgi:3',5'-cyclic-AMP phosphodiesterase
MRTSPRPILFPFAVFFISNWKKDLLPDFGNKEAATRVYIVGTRPRAARAKFDCIKACAAHLRDISWAKLDRTRDSKVARRKIMTEKIKDELLVDHNRDGIDRRGFLKCMAWAGTGALCVMQGGVLKSYSLSQMSQMGGKVAMGELSFVQISDSHMGFNKAANPDVVGTLKAAVDKINGLTTPPEFMLHTGDISHLSKPEEFDTVDQILKSATPKDVFFVPGEHDMLNDDGKQYLDRYGKGAKGAGWYSFDKKGVHFIGLVNVLNLKAGGLGTLGHEQLEWMEDDVKHLPHSTPIVVFAHIPLWSVYPEWGWGTEDSAEALAYLKKFGSVTVLNGHIHQTMQKVEGNVTFHTAASTAFPQPQPGKADSPGPMKVPAEQLKSLLGITDVSYVRGQHALGVVDSSLS